MLSGLNISGENILDFKFEVCRKFKIKCIYREGKERETSKFFRNVSEICINLNHRWNRGTSKSVIESNNLTRVTSITLNLSPIESTFFSFIVPEAGSRHSNEAFNLEKHLGKARESGRDVPETSPEEGDPFQAAQCNTTSTSNRVMGSGKDELLNWWKKIDAFFPVSWWKPIREEIGFRVSTRI